MKSSIFLDSNFIGLFLIYLIPVCVLDSQVYLVLYKMVLMMVIRFDLIYQSLYVGNLSSDVGKWSHLGGCLGHWGGPFTGEMNGFVIWERTPYGRVNAASSSLPPNCVLKHKCDDASCLVMALQHRLHRMPSPWYLILDAQVTRIVRKNWIISDVIYESYILGSTLCLYG